MKIRRAGIEDLEAVTELFDAYRQFYRQPSDLGRARDFLRSRLNGGDSVIFMACQSDAALGFVQLYPIFSSTAVRPGRAWLLNDLYVRPQGRGRGIARALMEQSRRHAVATGAVGIELSTARDNRVAQALYESLGYRRDERFYTYSLTLDDADSARGS